MKWKWVILFIAILFAGAGILFWFLNIKSSSIVSPVVNRILEKPLDKYTIENLGKRSYQSEIILDEPTATTSAYTTYLFHFDSDGKKVAGVAYVPLKCGQRPCPVIAQFRGFADVRTYFPGQGIQRSAQVFAKNGFISLAPDFLGYGGSDNPSDNVFEARFETYTTALNMLAGVNHWSRSNGKVGIWGHSNGGQISLTILEILGEKGQGYPTVLWAPVSMPFPYSILFFTDEADDKGKALRKELADFERDYDVFNYDLTRNLDKINSPLQIHQGTADDSMPKKWGDELVTNLKMANKDVKYFVYPGADHNMVGSWGTVVTKDVEFFRKNL